MSVSLHTCTLECHGGVARWDEDCSSSLVFPACLGETNFLGSFFASAVVTKFPRVVDLTNVRTFPLTMRQASMTAPEQE